MYNLCACVSLFDPSLVSIWGIYCEFFGFKSSRPPKMSRLPTLTRSVSTTRHPGTACPLSTSPSIPTGPEATRLRMTPESWACYH